jgi:hypothetical protein
MKKLLSLNLFLAGVIAGGVLMPLEMRARLSEPLASRIREMMAQIPDQ